MRRGKSLLGQTISLYCTRKPICRRTVPCQTDPGSLMRLAGTPILVLFPVVPTWRCSTAAPKIKERTIKPETPYSLSHLTVNGTVYATLRGLGHYLFDQKQSQYHAIGNLQRYNQYLRL